MDSYISERLGDLEQRLATFLDQMTEDIALEVEREQQHLMLMQDQASMLCLQNYKLLAMRHLLTCRDSDSVLIYCLQLSKQVWKHSF